MKKTKIIDIILPSKKINFFVFTILILGVISGSIFLVIASEADKNSVITQISSFLTNISNDSIQNGLALKNSLIINYVFVGVIWILGFSMIGILMNIFLTYIKGFLVGFSIASIFLSCGYKGIIPAILYVFPSQILNCLVVILLTIYSIMFSYNLLSIIVSKKNTNNRLMLKKYSIILMFCIIISFISSLFEVYVFPSVMKLFISYYV